MFQQTKTPFGGFGSTSTPFGATTKASGFGGSGTSTFGTSTGGFGQSTPSSSSNIFGSANTSTPGAGMFGSGTSSGGGGGFTFGQPTPQQNQQGTASVFGSSGLGSAPSGGLFSTPTNNSSFGTKTPGGFGSSTQNTGSSLFGSSNTSSGLFGSTATSTSQSGGGIFGSSGFGSTSNQNGSAVAKFNPPSGQDTMLKGGVSTNINTRHQCITAMKEYENRSLEELRMEDYLANRKGPQTTASTGSSGIFGNNSSQQQSAGFSLFGQSSQAQSKPTGFGFGTNTSTNSSGGLFGQSSQTQSTGLFGGSANKTLFGSTTTTAASNIGFSGFAQPSTPQSSSLFGQSQTKAGGLFGTVQQSSAPSLFGSTITGTNTSTFSGFGSGFGTSTAQQPTLSQGGLFAKPGVFGSTSTTQSSTGFNFGQSTQQTGLFGQNTATSKPTGFAFGQPNAATQSTGLFAKPTTAFSGSSALGGFGTTNTLGGTSTLSTTGGGLFGQAQKPFGQNLGSTLGTGTSTFMGGPSTIGGGALLGSAAPTLGATDANLAAQQAQITQQLMALNSAPYGDNPLFRNLKQNEIKREELTKPTNPSAQKAALNTSAHYKVNSRPTAKIKPKPIHSIAKGKAQLFEGLEEDDASTFGNDTFQPRQSVKKLLIKGDMNRSLNQSQFSVSRAGSETGTDDLSTSLPVPLSTEQKSKDLSCLGVIQSSATLQTSTEKKPSPLHSVQSPDFNQQKKSSRNLDSTIIELNMKNGLRNALDESRFDTSEEQETFDNLSDSSSHAPHPGGVVLRKVGYFSLPPVEELAEFVDENGNCFVENFVVGREGYGNVMFPGEINVAGMNLDEIVFFRRKEITVYPNDDSKPEVGKGLNRKAQVTLDCIWPTDKTTHTAIKDMGNELLMEFHEKLERASARIGAKFIDYRPETGSWVFEVRHFSKYGLVDSDDEDDAEIDPEKLKQLKQQQQKALAVQRQKIALKDLDQAQMKSQQLQKKDKMKSGFKMTEDEEEHMIDDVSELKKISGERDKIDLSSDAVHRSVGLQGLQSSLPPLDSVMKEGDDDHSYNEEKLLDPPDEMDAYLASRLDMGQVPASHRLALGLGIRAHDLQIRKASFFGDDNDFDDGDIDMEKDKLKKIGFSGFIQSPLQSQSVSSSVGSKQAQDSPDRSSVLSVSLKQPQEHCSAFSPHKPLSPYRGSFIPPRQKAQKQIPGSKDHVLIPSGLIDNIQKRKIVGTRIIRCIPALKASLLDGRQGCLADLGLFHGRRSRVGWGSHWSFVHCGDPMMKANDHEVEVPNFSILPNMSNLTKGSKLDSSPFQLCVEKVHADPQMIFSDRQTNELIECCLQIQLNNSNCNMEQNCPLYTPKPGVNSLHQYATEVTKQNANFDDSHPDKRTVQVMSEVWRLCVALWGNIPELMIDDTSDKNSYHYDQARKEALSRWINQVSLPKIDDEIEKGRAKGMTEINSVYSLLTGRRISEACLLAQDCGDHRLALLMSQAIGAETTKSMLKKQLVMWRDTQADVFIEPVYLKMYSLLAGNIVWPASHITINSCDNLDWKRCLALHLWYYCPTQATISDGLRYYNHAYQEAGEGEECSAVPPLPRYLEDDENSYQHYTGRIYDVCYQLLQLYSDRSTELHVLLNPATITPNTLDYRLSWHLGQVLYSLEYEHLSELQHESLCCNYASQLEAAGLWHWGVFVLLHIKNDSQRENAVKEVIFRHIEVTCDEEHQMIERFIFHQLKVPVAWKHEAKAYKARAEGRPHEEAWHLLKAQRWNHCHQLLLSQVASEAIINEHYDYLKKILLELGSSEQAQLIKDWATGGKVFLDYINMIQTIEQLKQGEPSAYELEQLLPEVTSLAQRISHMPCQNSKDRLCQSEMAKRVANVMKTLMTMHNPDEDLSIRVMAPTQLPMPEDYAIQELQQLTHSYMMELTML